MTLFVWVGNLYSDSSIYISSLKIMSKLVPTVQGLTSAVVSGLFYWNSFYQEYFKRQYQILFSIKFFTNTWHILVAIYKFYAPPQKKSDERYQWRFLWRFIFFFKEENLVQLTVQKLVCDCDSMILIGQVIAGPTLIHDLLYL